MSVCGLSICGLLLTATGKLLWRRDWSKEIDTSKLFTGTAMSLLVVRARQTSPRPPVLGMLFDF